MEHRREQMLREIAERLDQLMLSEPVRAAIMLLLNDQPARPPQPVKLMTPAEIARSFQRSSIRRGEYFGRQLIGGSAWNMLLEMFATYHEDRQVCVSSLCYASGGPSTTALRQLDLLKANGLVERADDKRDHRRTWVIPTRHTIETMAQLIGSFRIPASQPLVSSRPAS